jgi:hypothetical protein
MKKNSPIMQNAYFDRKAFILKENQFYADNAGVEYMPLVISVVTMISFILIGYFSQVA